MAIKAGANPLQTSQSMLQWLRRNIRCCVLCGRWEAPKDCLCLDCEWRIRQRMDPDERSISAEIRHYYLFPWWPNDPLFRELIPRLKGPGPSEFFLFWASLWLEQDWPGLEARQIFYPSKGVEDHASQLAKAFAGLSGAEPRPLRREERGKQSRKNRRDRAQTSIRPVDFRIGGPSLLVDDVVTTGATAKACWLALGRPSNLTVWSLFYRKSL